MTVLITGASKGLGKALCETLEPPVQIVGIDRSWEQTTTSPVQPPCRIKANLTNTNNLALLVQKVQDFGPFDTVVHNAAISATGPFENIPASTHQKIIDVNATAPIVMTNELIKNGSLSHNATIVFISSLSVMIGYPGAASYAASKAMLANYAKSLQIVLKSKNINVLTVFPGPMDTDQASRHAPDDASAEKRMRPDDVANQIWNSVAARHQTLVPGATNRLVALAGRLAPHLTSRYMKKIIYDKLSKTTY